MADYAGAVAAIKARLSANWSTTRIVETNQRLENWPPVDANGDPTPWVLIEVIGNDARQTSTGSPGGSWHVDEGHVVVHVFVETKRGTETALQYAVTIGEIFRNEQFYTETAGHAVRTWTPRVDGGGNADVEGVPSGSWYRVTVTIPFEYLHLA